MFPAKLDGVCVVLGGLCSKTWLTSCFGVCVFAQVSAQEASDCRAKLARDTLELGKIVSVKTGHVSTYTP